MRRIGECPSPWPCFVIAVREDFIKNEPSILNTILEIINNTTLEFKTIPCIDKTIANRYDQKLTDVQEWLGLTEWSQAQISEETLKNVQNQLFAINIIEKIVDFNRLTHQV